MLANSNLKWQKWCRRIVTRKVLLLAMMTLSLDSLECLKHSLRGMHTFTGCMFSKQDPYQDA